MACFHVISITVISGGDHIVLTTVCGYYLCALLLCSMTHYDITMAHELLKMTHCGITVGNDVVRDIHCDVTMCNDVAMCTYHGITMHNDVVMNHFC